MKNGNNKRPEDNAAGATRSLDGSVIVPGAQIGPFTIEREETKTVGYIIVSTDRGLCGGLNTNLLLLNKS